ncbi:MAG TPA: complex I NDUFA9 subunit family protein [Chromatiales bacterium]|nr:complex I NDUFA9 subunit family protein [Thiotrichales bacterium]HIP67203.1 complex I NDUFA9 subunit family protein [Chromatiales bacterium]
MKVRTICILGGTGFVGSHISAKLASENYRIKILTRHPQRHRHLLVLPQLTLIKADIHNPTQLASQLKGCDAAINLVGILNETGKNSFRRVHEELAVKVVNACKQNNVQRLLHMSALNADAGGPSEYLRSKGKAENYVHTFSGQNLATTSFRPSVIFGPGDSFLNRFAGLLKQIPFFFPLACPNALFQPVYVGDVADAFIKALTDETNIGRHINLCGPQTYTLKQLVEFTAKTIDVRRKIIGLPDWASRLQARLMGVLPGKPFTMDNYNSMKADSVCTQGENCSTSLEMIAPKYLGKSGHEALIQKLRETTRS